jgi:hypothetical protein
MQLQSIPTSIDANFNRCQLQSMPTSIDDSLIDATSVDTN